MSVYSGVLEAVLGVVSNLAVTASAKVVLRSSPTVKRGNSGDGDTFPLVIVSPDRHTWEDVGELAFESNTEFKFPVILTAVIDNAFDQTSLFWQLDFREQAMQALFATTLAGTAVYDCEYDPAPSGVDLSGVAPPLLPSAQRFTYSVEMLRGRP